MNDLLKENDEDQNIVINMDEQPAKFCRHEDGVIAWFEIKKPSNLAGHLKGIFLRGERAQQLLKSVEGL